MRALSFHSAQLQATESAAGNVGKPQNLTPFLHPVFEDLCFTVKKSTNVTGLHGCKCVNIFLR